MLLERELAKMFYEPPKRPRDAQQGAVYKWERIFSKWYTTKRLSLEECREMVDHVWNDYFPGVNPPDVTDGRGRRSAAAFGAVKIALPRQMRTAVVVLHELGHCIMDYSGLDRLPWHGRHFATLLLDLCVRYLGMNRADLRNAAISQRPRRVRFEALSKVPQPKKRTYPHFKKHAP